jgi:hypothetical protein
MERSARKPRTNRDRFGHPHKRSIPAQPEQSRTVRIQQVLATNQGPVVLGTIVALTLLALVVLLF